jgi:hypothetical protein
MPAVWLVGLTLGIAMLPGCGQSEPASPAPSPATAPVAPPPPLKAAPAKETAAPEKAPDSATKASAPAAPAKAPAAKEESKMIQKEAAVGAGAKGRGYGEGMVATPVATYFFIKERLAYDIQIPHALNLYKATEGHAPKTHEEFMEKIIKFNHIKLPELPPGETYRYDPAQEKLMVLSPQTKTSQ